MRTRIALVAIIPIALFTAAPLAQAASAQPARVSTRSAHHASTTTPARRADRLTSYVRPRRPHPSPAVTTAFTVPDERLANALLTGQPVGTKQVTAIVPPPPPPAPVPTGPVDTVTSTQRAEWDRVAMCEEGGNWEADGSRFSGGLGITRSNWDSYGGLQYAPEAAEASPDEQIMVAERIQAYPPDQGGCSSW
jgi:hypothetical protein